jgi:hypothetical protein
MSARELLPVEVLRFDWSDVDSRFGLPRALADGRPARLASIPALVVPEWDLERTEFRYGAELVICSLRWLRAFYMAADGNGADPQVTFHGDYADLPHAVALALRNDLGNVEWSALGMVERALAHAVTATGVAPCRALHVEDLNTLSLVESERRLFAILRGEKVAPLVFVNQTELGADGGEVAC